MRTLKKISLSKSNYCRMLLPFVFFCMPFLNFAQISLPKKINNEMSVELKAIQTPARTFVAAIMTTKSGSFSDNLTRVFRSADMGQTWDSVFAVEADSVFVRNPDPVICMDSTGVLYLIMMRITKIGSKGQLWCYSSADDGKTWSVAGYPYQGSSLPDYPQCVAKGKGEIYLTFLEYPSYIKFVKSTDGGKTWSSGININDNSVAGDPVGADIGWTNSGKFCVAYGTYSKANLYISTSDNLGKSWTQSIVQAGISKFAVNKLVSSNKFMHLGVLSHRPHNSQTVAYYSRSADVGKTWNTQVLDSNASLAEGLIDNSGNIHIIYNKNVKNTFSLMYVFSSNQGQNFSKPSVLYSAPMGVTMAYGEYQSLLLSNDGLLHATFVDFGDKFKTKQIIFSPMLNATNQGGAQQTLPLVYPNPTNNAIHIMLMDLSTQNSYKLCSLTGELIAQGKLTDANTKIDVSGIGRGTYILRIHQGNRIFITKFLIP